MRRTGPILTAALILASAAPAAAQTRYTVFCVNNRIVVDMRTPDAMARQQFNSCPIRTFTSYGDARDFARRNHGDEGARCSCR